MSDSKSMECTDDDANNPVLIFEVDCFEGKYYKC